MESVGQPSCSRLDQLQTQVGVDVVALLVHLRQPLPFIPHLLLFTWKRSRDLPKLEPRPEKKAIPRIIISPNRQHDQNKDPDNSDDDDIPLAGCDTDDVDEPIC